MGQSDQSLTVYGVVLKCTNTKPVACNYCKQVFTSDRFDWLENTGQRSTLLREINLHRATFKQFSLHTVAKRKQISLSYLIMANNIPKHFK